MTDFKILEVALVVLALLPCLLAPLSGVHAGMLRILGHASVADPVLRSLSAGSLLFLGILFQLSALYWVEVSWLHAWIKRRVQSGSRGEGGVRVWQNDFAQFAREKGSIP